MNRCGVPSEHSSEPFPLQAYAGKDPTFPTDSTADQWFDADQFDAYAALGDWIGDKMVNPRD